MNDLDCAVLVPAHNESRTIAQVVRESVAHATRVVVVDDGSTDDTGRLAAEAGAHVLRNTECQGLGATLRRGLTYLKDVGVETVVTLDGDGAHDPSHIPGLLRSHSAAHADLTIGTRFAGTTASPVIPSPKVAANFFATALVNEVLGCTLSDVASGMRVLSRNGLSLQFTSTDYAISFEFIAASLRHKLMVNEYPITVRYDAEELFCTARGELLNLLAFAIGNIQNSPELLRSVSTVTAMVNAYALVRVRTKGAAILLHPLAKHEAYAFQFQHPWFSETRKDTEWLAIG